MNNKVLILTGACGVGKSTLSKLWAKSNNGAVVECDYFTEWIFNEKLKQFSLEEETLVAKLTIKTSIEYLKAEMPVAIENVWTPAGLQQLKSAFEAMVKPPQLKFVWLYCDIPENHIRDKQRRPEDHMKERVDIVNAEQRGYDWPDYLHAIDSTNLTEQETLSAIKNLKYLSN